MLATAESRLGDGTGGGSLDQHEESDAATLEGLGEGIAISLGQEESRPTACGGLEEGDAAATLECLYCPPTSRSDFHHLFEGLCLCTCACCCPAAAQRASAGATSGAGGAKSGAGSRAGAAWTWCSTTHVERAVRQRREQRRLPGSGVSNCAFVGATPSPSPASRRSRGTCSSGSTRHNEVGRSLCCG